MINPQASTPHIEGVYDNFLAKINSPSEPMIRAGVLALDDFWRYLDDRLDYRERNEMVEKIFHAMIREALR